MSMYRRIRTYGFMQQLHGCVCSSSGLLAGCRQRDKGDDVETAVPPMLEAEVYSRLPHAAFCLDAIDFIKGMEKRTPVYKLKINIRYDHSWVKQFWISAVWKTLEKAQLIKLLSDLGAKYKNVKIAFPSSSSGWQIVNAKLLDSHFLGHVYFEKCKRKHSLHLNII